MVFHYSDTDIWTFFGTYVGHVRILQLPKRPEKKK